MTKVIKNHTLLIQCSSIVMCIFLKYIFLFSYSLINCMVFKKLSPCLSYMTSFLWVVFLSRCIRLRSEGMEVPLYTAEDHNHFVDLYFVLLYKFQRKAFLDEVSIWNLIHLWITPNSIVDEYGWGVHGCCLVGKIEWRV